MWGRERAIVLRFYASFYYYIKWLLDFFFISILKVVIQGTKKFLFLIVVWSGNGGMLGVELSLFLGESSLSQHIHYLQNKKMKICHEEKGEKFEKTKQNKKTRRGLKHWNSERWQFYSENCLYRFV